MGSGANPCGLMPVHVGGRDPARRATYTAASFEVCVKHWIVMFRPETYAAAQAHGMMAVLHSHRRRFAEVAVGDRFVAYISRQRVLDAHGEVVSEPFEEVAQEPKGWIRYTERARVRFDQTGAAIDARELLWGLSVCGEGIKTEPTNLLFCKGGFMEIPKDDYDWLRDVMAGRASPTPARNGQGGSP